MFREIVKNEFYEVAIDIQKNRLYLTTKGFWSSAAKVPNFITDIKKALLELKPGFSLLTDSSQQKTPPQEVMPVFVQLTDTLRNAKVGKVGNVFGHEATVKLAADRFGRKYEVPKNFFDNRDSAEAFLDAP